MITEVQGSPNNDLQNEKGERVVITPYEVENATKQDDRSARVLTKSTQNDATNMHRMGRNQEFVRRFKFLSVASFTALCTAAWELGMFLITPALIDGGRAELLWGNLISFIGFAPIYLSLAEMTSMAPIAGGQYHWVSEFAPERFQRSLSYLTGWTTTLAWQSGNALGVFLTGTLIQAIISVNFPDYDFPAWHGTLLVIASIVITFAGNTFGAKILHAWQTPVFAIHILVYFALIIPIWVKVPSVPSKEVWASFENNGGWSNMATALLIGQVAGIYNQVGIDTVAHMSEEVADAASSVPNAMVATYIINFALIFPCLITLCYHMPVVTDALDDVTTYPAIYVMRQVGNLPWMNALLIITAIILMCSNITYLAAVSRDAFAFARDQGVPFSKWIAHIDAKRKIPQNACIVTCVIGIILALMYLGSPVAFYAITSVCTVALLQGYTVCIACVLWRRIRHPETLPKSRFSLGRFGIPLNIAGLLYSFWSLIWTFWPQTYPITAPDFNWAIVIFTATVVVAVIDFTFRARHVYVGPATLVKGRFANPE